MKKTVLLFLSLFFMFSSCVSKKKHLEVVQTLKVEHENFYTSEANKWRSELNESQDSVTSLRLQLAERKGENNILINLRSELKVKIAQLEGQLENVNVNSQSTQQNLSSTLQAKEEQIAGLKNQLQKVEAVLNNNKADFNRMSGDLHFALQEIGYQDFDLTSTVSQLKLILPETLLFRKKRIRDIQKQGLEVLEEIAKVINRYPSMNIIVTGHTDNSRTGSSSFPDNWSFSAQQAATIADLLSHEFDVTSNQLLAAGKGEAEPRASNETSEGKTLNRRVELVFVKRGEDLERAIRKELGN